MLTCNKHSKISKSDRFSSLDTQLYSILYRSETPGKQKSIYQGEFIKFNNCNCVFTYIFKRRKKKWKLIPKDSIPLCAKLSLHCTVTSSDVRGQYLPRTCPRCKGINPGCSKAQQMPNWPQGTSTWYSYISWLSWNKIQFILSFKAWFINSFSSRTTAVSRNFIFFLHQCYCTRIMWMLLCQEKVLWTLRT